MEISNEFLVNIFYIIIIVGIFIFIIKKSIKLVFTAIAILVVFTIGFRIDGDSIRSTKLNNYFGDSVTNSIAGFFDEFAAKREEFGIVDTEKVYSDMKTTMVQGGKFIIVEGIGSLDIDGFAHQLAEDLYHGGFKDVSLKDIQAEIKKQLNVEDSEAQKIAEKVYTELKDK